MKNKIFSLIKRGTICCAISLICFSCVDDDLNQPKYKPLKLSVMDYIERMNEIVNPAQNNKYQHNNSMLGDCYGRYMSITSDAWLENFSNFNAKDSWIDSPFKDVLTGFYPNWIDLEEKVKGEGIHYSWAKILRVAAMQRLTDMYGPIPYSKMGTGLSQTPYDSQEDVYKAMFEDLNSAIEEITESIRLDSENKQIDDEGKDHVYGGNMIKWLQFANSLKLRMALRIVYADESLAKENAESAITHIYGVMKSNDDNAAISFEPNPINIMWEEYKDSRACADIVSYMTGYNDPRLGSYFKETTTAGYPKYIGLRTGIDLSKLTQAKAQLYSTPNIERDEPLMWMNAAEVAFLKAEGALRGWNMGGTAEDFYKEGVRLSFEQYKLSGADTYLTNNTNKPAGYIDPNNNNESAQSTITIKWEESADAEEKLERIITQKWIAMWPLGQEAWSEQRRTGYPRFFKVLENRSAEASLSTKFAARIPFSPAERITNPDNLNAAIQLLGGPDGYGTKLWWDKKTNKP